MPDLTKEILNSKKIVTVTVESVLGVAEVDIQFHTQVSLEEAGEVFGAIEKAAKQAKKKAFRMSLENPVLDSNTESLVK